MVVAGKIGTDLGPLNAARSGMFKVLQLDRHDPLEVMRIINEVGDNAMNKNYIEVTVSWLLSWTPEAQIFSI